MRQLILFGLIISCSGYVAADIPAWIENKTYETIFVTYKKKKHDTWHDHAQYVSSGTKELLGNFKRVDNILYYIGRNGPYNGGKVAHPPYDCEPVLEIKPEEAAWKAFQVLQD